MTTYNTGNPIGSTDPKDLYDNAQNLDALVNSTTELSHADRLAVQRKTWHGMEVEFDAAQAERAGEFAQFLADSAYQDLGVYGAGIEVTRYNQVFLKDGEFYRAAASLGLPYTTTGLWASESGSFVGVGDAVLRQDLGAPGGSALVGSDDGAGGSLWKTVAGFIVFLFSGLGASVVGFIQSGTGAVSRTVQSKLRDVVSVRDFGAVGDGVTDDTAAIQAAINTGKPLVFQAGNYKSGPLTQSANFQRFYADGHVNITKNANGVLFTSTGNYVELDGLQFVGTGYTGDNINMTGGHPRLVNCASYGTPGRALKATGAHVQIIGTCGIYATTDTTATGYDIEIGVSGTATLYHQLIGVYTSQATGGILLTDTGSHVISGGQFGKLTIKSGTSPTGVNGGMTANARIIGDVSVELSNSTFSGNQFHTQTITFALGTSSHCLDTSNIISSATIVNNGNGNSPIIKSVGTGSPSGLILQYGSDANNATIRYVNGEIYFQNNSLNLLNGKSIRFADAAGTYRTALNLSSGDDWTIGYDTGANFMNIVAGSGGIYLRPGDTSTVQCATSYLRPVPDGTVNLGGASNRWGTVYASTGTINTSDARNKQQVRELTEAERAVAVACKSLLMAFKFNDAVEAKGEAARWHFGVIAQDVAAAFEAEGLNAHDYGLFCHDEWEAVEAVTEEILDDEGNPTGETRVIAPAIEAGDRYGVRYEELLAFIIAAL